MSPHQFRLIEATDNEAGKIAALAAHIWQQHYPAIIGQKQVDYMLDLLYSESALKTQMQEGQKFYLIRIQETDAGYISVSDKGDGHYFLHKFYIDPSLQARGLGKAVFAATTALFPDLNKWTLTVNRKNYKSINFYFRNGFVIDSVADFDIGNGYFMEDFVMSWHKS
ncbi:MAG: GNAT family N-acetyltransferase [Bacteroidia bacterium]|jgi:RimJ/RimL family protein N-acetyltransferase|nr:GNAT family N-acetyltransferase [Bacteroidia bacterium]